MPLETLVADLVKHLLWIRFDLNQTDYARSALKYYDDLLKPVGIDLMEEVRKAINEKGSETRCKS